MLLLSSHKSCPTLCDPMNYNTPDFPVLHYFPEFGQTQVHGVNDAIQPSHPLSPPSPGLNPSQHQGLSQWVSSSHQVAKVLELQLQHQSFQWIFGVDFLQDWLVWSPCCPRDSQQSSIAPQFKSSTVISSSRHTTIEISICHYRRRQWHPTPVLLPGESHGWRSLVGCSPWGR